MKFTIQYHLLLDMSLRMDLLKNHFHPFFIVFGKPYFENFVKVKYLLVPNLI